MQILRDGMTGRPSPSFRYADCFLLLEIMRFFWPTCHRGVKGTSLLIWNMCWCDHNERWQCVQLCVYDCMCVLAVMWVDVCVCVCWSRVASGPWLFDVGIYPAGWVSGELIISVLSSVATHSRSLSWMCVCVVVFVCDASTCSALHITQRERERERDPCV